MGTLSLEIVRAARDREPPIFATLPAHIEFNPEKRCYSTWNSIFYPDTVFGLLALHDAPARFALISTAVFDGPEMTLETVVRPGTQLEMRAPAGTLRPCAPSSSGLSRTADYAAAVTSDGALLAWWRPEVQVMLTWSGHPPHLRRSRPICRARPVGHAVLPGLPENLWEETGTAFTEGPSSVARGSQGDIFNPGGSEVINSFTTAEGDAATGRLEGPWIPVRSKASHVCGWVGGGGRKRNVGLLLRGENDFERHLVGADTEMMLFRCARVRGQKQC